MSALSPLEPVEIGLIGFGAFGRLMARHLHGHFRLLAYDPLLPGTGDVVDGATTANIETVAQSQFVILAGPVSSFEETTRRIAPLLRPGVVVVDVGSVKTMPADIMRRNLPDHVEIVGTHPLFGPQSAKPGLTGLSIAVCPIRGQQVFRMIAFLRRVLHLEVIVTTPEAHDREMATIQGLTHLIAKVMLRMEPLPSRMSTRSFNALMQSVDMVRHDAAEVFAAIECANPYARGVRQRFFAHAAALGAELDG